MSYLFFYHPVSEAASRHTLHRLSSIFLIGLINFETLLVYTHS